MKKEIFTTEDVRQFFLDCGVDPADFDLEGHKNLYNVLAIMTEHKMSKDDILDGYSLMRNTMIGGRPEIIKKKVPNESVIRTLTREMERCDQFKGKLELIEKFKFAFCVWHSTNNGLEDFADLKRIEELFWEDRTKNEERYCVPEPYLIPGKWCNNPTQHDLMLFANACMDPEMKSFELLKPRLTKNCRYKSEKAKLDLKGVEQIEAHLRYIKEKSTSPYFFYLAKLLEIEKDSEYRGRPDCLAMGFLEEHNIVSILFLDYDEGGLISEINGISNYDYRIRYLDHMVPEQRDDYGTLDNPIEVTEISTEYMYMNSLHFDDESPVFYKRTGSWDGPRVHPIDRFLVWRSQEDMDAGKDPEAELYLYGYGKRNSKIPPDGFRLGIREIVRRRPKDELENVEASRFLC